MIITRTPFRISFVGGGSDLRSFYEQHPGAVLSTSINKYMYISSHKFFEDDKIRVKYSKTETVTGTKELQHPILRTVLDQFKIKGGIEFSSIADVPAGTGLGSSSSFTVGLLHNLHVLRHELPVKLQLAEEACHIEINLLQEPIGKQDQYAAAVGGLNVIEFHSDGKVSVDPLHLEREAFMQLQKNLLMFYTGDQRSASAILCEQNKNNAQDEKLNTLMKMVRLVHDAKDALQKGKLEDFGKILHENWILKKTLATGITNSVIETAYQTAMEHGALGGKLLGAGGGGFLLFYCPIRDQENLIAALKPFRKFDFTFEEEGTKLIHISDE